MKIAGFEIPDLIAVFLLLAILNFLFNQTSFKLFLVWAPSISFALFLRIVKRDKPDGYIMHLVQYWVTPKHICAFKTPTSEPERGVHE